MRRLLADLSNIEHTSSWAMTYAEVGRIEKMESNEKHVQTSSDSESVDDIQAALFVTHLEARSCDGEKRPIKKEINTWVDKER
jgi:hypothetical protein